MDSAEKKFNLSEKMPYVKCFFDSWPITSEVSVELAVEKHIVFESDHRELYDIIREVKLDRSYNKPVILLSRYLGKFLIAHMLLLQLLAEAPKLTEYQSYIDYELKAGDPARIQIIFERALVENCLVPDLWEKFTTYLVRITLLQLVFDHILFIPPAVE